MVVFKDATADGGEEVRVENFVNAGTNALVAKNSRDVAQCGIAVAELAIAEDLTDMAKDAVALGFIDGHRCGGARGFTLGSFGFGNDLFVLGLRGDRGPRGLYAKGGDSGADFAAPSDDGADSSTI